VERYQDVGAYFYEYFFHIPRDPLDSGARSPPPLRRLERIKAHWFTSLLSEGFSRGFLQ